MIVMSELKKTHLHEKHVGLGAKLVPFASFDMPISYSTLVDEHMTVREQVGIFDVSHMGEILIEGEEAEAFVSYLFTNDIVNIPEHKVVYGFMCTENGGIVDDLLVYKYNRHKYLLVVNASNIDKDYNHIISHREIYKVMITNLSNEYSEIAIQGPKAQQVLQKMTDTDLNTIPFFTFQDLVIINGVECIVSRTGYTGEDGFEVYAKNENIGAIWDYMLEVGKEEAIKPIGLGARDTLRFEAGLPLYGNELSDDVTPLEAGFGFFVKLDHDFIGRDVIAQQKEQGVNRKTVGIEVLDKGIVRHGYKVFNEQEEEIGVVTTGYLLPGRERSIALALVDAAYSALDTKLLVEMRSKKLQAVVCSKKFMNKNYKK